MKRILTFVLAAALVLSLAACAKTPGAEPPEKLYVLTHQREAVYLVGADGAEKVYDLPGPMMTADVCGSVLWYVEGDSLVRVGLADGSKTEYALPENEGGGYYMFAAENEAYVALANGQYDNLHTGEIYRAGEDDAYVDIADGQYDNLYTGEIYRVGANGAEQVTHGYAYYMTTCPFTVDGGSVYFLAGGVPAGSELKLVREDADGTRVEFERPGFPLFALSVDGGRVYACWAYDCRSYDAATGGDERIETAFAPISSHQRVKTAGATESGSLPHSAAAHGGWLYYAACNYESEGADDSTLLMARRISDGKLVEYATAEDVGFYGFDSVVTFGERGFVLDDGYQTDIFRYIPYDAGE